MQVSMEGHVRTAMICPGILCFGGVVASVKLLIIIDLAYPRWMCNNFRILYCSIAVQSLPRHARMVARRLDTTPANSCNKP